ncbi:hypothetical protein [Streptomyces sp. NPDC046985]|uniref:hypothetical protein n=1 Tax=Streptomyces sp. NPDC046985 TaxID=3155377 RepID=UPI0033F2B671
MSEEGPERDADAEHGNDRQRNVIAGLITCTAVGAAVAHVLDPGLKIDAITAVLLAVAALPWLGALFESIELPGGAKVQYRKLARRVSAAEERTDRAGQAADDASRAARLAFVAASGSDDQTAADSTARDDVARLAAAYTQVREHMDHGPARTTRMEHIFADLVTATVRDRSFDVEGSLTSQSPGIRLAAYARLYARPQADAFGALTDAVLADGLPFNQYWGFQAMAAVADTAGRSGLRYGDVERLEDCLARLPRDSDRAGVLARLIARIKSL